jgi:predicted nucleotidyltransferase
MISELTDHRSEIAALCQRFHVRRLDVFGSAARGADFTPASDIDFLVEFEPDHPRSFGEYLELRDKLEILFERKVDLTMAGAVRNPFIRAAIDRSRVPLHGA